MPAARIAMLQEMLAAREGKPGYKRNVEALKLEIARLVEIQDLATFAAPPDVALTSGGEVP